MAGIVFASLAATLTQLFGWICVYSFMNGLEEEEEDKEKEK